MSLKNQKAEIRACVGFDGSHALVGSIDVKGADIYCSTTDKLSPDQGPVQRTRVSYHGSGASRLHMEGVPTQASVLPRLPPTELRGAMKMGAHAPVLRDSDYWYSLKNDSPKRHTLIVDAKDLPRGLGVEFWAIEPRNANALQLALNTPVGEEGVFLEPVAYVLAAWTTPPVLIVVKTAPEKIWSDMQAELDKKPRPPEQRHTPFIYAVTSLPGSGLYRDSGLYIPSERTRVPRQ